MSVHCTETHSQASFSFRKSVYVSHCFCFVHINNFFRTFFYTFSTIQKCLSFYLNFFFFNFENVYLEWACFCFIQGDIIIIMIDELKCFFADLFAILNVFWKWMSVVTRKFDAVKNVNPKFRTRPNLLVVYLIKCCENSKSHHALVRHNLNELGL